ncbi:protein patched-like isoform X4 [Sitodiplosis mosellana]|uniref:protein patched-like isoform X4 n=1 Tax=Sitodiplosis mosellana TaxID=263140 RepID=UPI00244526AD|nr:protein patched-like isoform X4 [Sitodiplosis mosellana]
MIKGKAHGRRSALYIRSLFQSQLQTLGIYVQKNAGKILFVAIIVLSAFCVGLKSATIHSKVQQLWIQEGGRLEQELTYTQKSLGEIESTTHQLLIQTPKDPDASVLHPQALLTHLEVLEKATSIKIEMFEKTWDLRDICIAPTIPPIEFPLVDQIFERLIPCSIITPLDCFWEGSKLLGPDYSPKVPGWNDQIYWTSLNPQKMLETLKNSNQQFPFDIVDQYLKRAGISTGFTEKPCLNPLDPLCPNTAPNKKSRSQVDIGAELTGGCYSYAAKYMHWPEELIVGGAERNRTRHLKRAKALQTVIQLMTEREMFESFKGHWDVHHMGWSQEKAAAVLNAWQRKFSNEVSKIMKYGNLSRSHDIFAFSSSTLDDILSKYSNPNTLSLCIFIGVTIVYAVIISIRYKDPIRGQGAVVIAGVLLIGMATAAGLGLCAMLGRAFNASTTQVIPFLAIGLGVNHIFVLTHAYAESNTCNQTKDVLKKAGPTILLSASTAIASFFAAALIPVPALKIFCIQSAIVMCFNLAASLLVFPAMISLDLRRRQSGRKDFFCCCYPPMKQSQNTPGNGNNRMNGADQSLIVRYADKNISKFSLSQFAYKYYAKFITQGSIKFFGMLILAGVMGYSLINAMKIEDGLDLFDLVPKNTNEHQFLNIQSKMFSFYNMFAVTQGDFEYPTNQRLLYEYHEAFVRVPQVIKNDNGGLPDFWLSMFRDWLINLQNAFDRDYKHGKITQERWYRNASTDAILAYKLLVQTGYVDNPIDKSLVTTNRLVDSEGIINPKAFYNYLSAWAWNDVFSYSASQGKLRPEPREWTHSPADYELKIPKSAPLTYTQLPFYLHGLSDTPEIRTLISTIRELCGKFEGRGLPNYPSGIPFIFWEQYMDLRIYLSLIILCVLCATFICVGILLLSAWAAVLIVFNAVSTLIQLVGIMTFLDMKLSAIPAVIMVLSVGLSVSFTVHVSLGFITSVGNRDRRIRLALQSSFAPVVHATLTSLLAVFMLSTSQFDFIVRQFFWLLLAVMLIGIVNGLFFFPILLNLVGPAPELVPLGHPDRISTPSPPTYRQKRSKSYNTNRHSTNSSSSRSYQKPYHKQHTNMKDEPSLTTITEEPHSWKSSSSSMSTNGHHTEHQFSANTQNSSNNLSELQSIVVQPEVIVETSQNGGDSNTMKVTATANIKVELVTPRITRTYSHS